MQVDKELVNKFCSSKLWLSQLTTVATVIPEAEFIVPGMMTGQCGSSAEGRRNYTDLQETSQWLGGVDIPSKVLDDLLKGFLALFQCFLIFQNNHLYT